jgi:hypothetical protein
MPVYLLDCRFICHTHMVWLYPNKLPIFLMCFVDALVALSLSCLQEKPEIREFGEERTWNISNFGVGGEVWDKPEEHESDGNCPGSEDEVGDGHSLEPRICCRGGYVV